MHNFINIDIFISKDSINILDSSFYADITMTQLQKIFRSDSDTPVPMLEKRLQVLHESGRILNEVIFSV